METDPANHPPLIDPRGCRILVVDDDRINQRILSGILKADGYVLGEADSGEKGLEVYAQFRPQLVLLDVEMPGIDGFTTCRALKKTYGEACAPVIFITARNEADDVVEGLDAGGVDYLTKPFRPKEVAARIRTHLVNRLLDEQRKQLVEQLSKANAAKNRFLGMAAHDLRNPLASIRGLAELMLADAVGSITPEQANLVQTIHSAAQGMLELVNELLDVATIESGELKLDGKPEELAPIVERSVYLNSIQAANKGTKVVMAPALCNPVALVDAAKIRQVVDNLISNAVKFSPPNSVVTVEVGGEGGVCGFSVRDQGPGIPEGERDKLFKDFSRLSVRPTGGEKSTGLGLAICSKIIDAHHGTITATNIPAPGRGCEFRVSLPSLR